jgi:hypothetical protein
MSEPKYKVKQWVRFYKDNRMVIGVVEYVIQDRAYSGEFNYQTDMGQISEQYILEAR